MTPALALRALAFFVCAATASAQKPPFFPLRSFTVGAGATFVTVADFNSDGAPDAATANTDAGTMSLLIGDGLGGFAPAQTLPLAFLPQGLTSGDLNGDGKADLVTWTTTINSAVALPGDGAGGFVTPITTPVSAFNPASLALGDFDGDGKLDLIGPNGINNTTSILLGDGAGAFPFAVTVPSGTNPTLAIPGDINGDGKLDAATSGSGSTVLLNRGFGFQSVIQVSAWPLVALGDLTGDGAADVVSAGSSYLGNSVHVAQSDGAGGFVSAGVFPCSILGKGGSVADINGDGRADLVLFGSTTTAEVSASVLLGQLSGPSALSSSLDFFAGVSPTSLVLADLRGISKLDVVSLDASAGAGVPGALGVALNNGDGSFPTAPAIATTASPIILGSLCTLDANVDGVTDLLSTNSSGVSAGMLTLFLGTGAATYAPPLVFYPFGNASDLRVADLNGDGRGDAILRTGSNVGVMLNSGFGYSNPTFVSFSPISYAYCFGIGEMNGDGLIDVIGSGFGGSNTFVAVSIGSGSGSFAPPNLVTIPSSSTMNSLVVGDLNNDGKQDVVGAMGNPTPVNVFLGDGSGSLAAPTAFGPSGGGHTVALGDLDADGSLDAVVGYFAYPASDILVFRGDGLGALTLGATTSLLSATGPYEVLVADLDGDGHADVIARTGSPPGQLTILRGDGSGGLSAPEHYRVPGYALFNSIALRDVDGTGRLDVLGTQENRVRRMTNAIALPSGTSPYGSGTNGCLGVQGLAATSVPSVNSPTFGFVSTNTPTLTHGLLLVTDAQDAVGSDLFGIGIKLHVDLLSASQTITLDISSGSAGGAFSKAPIPNAPSLAGLNFFAQAIWLWPAGATCDPSPYGLSSSRGLKLTIAP